MLIGVFHPHDPFAVMTEGRIEAIVAEAIKQHVQLVFFNESGVDLERKMIEGIVVTPEGRESGVFPFPGAIMNVRPWGPLRRSNRELILRKTVPFTTFLIGDKWDITQRMAHSPTLSPLIVPSAVLGSADQVDELLQLHDKLIIKPVRGSRGEGVQALIRQEGRYGVQRGAEWIWMNRGELSEFIAQLPRDYLVQPYIVCLTPDGEPYDFRILVQRNGDGIWEVTIIYPRIGAKETVASNVSVGGRTENLDDFLMRLFPDDYRSFPPLLTNLGLEIAEFIDSHYANPLDELGIDIAIDAQRRLWFYEANTCPGTLYYERERAVRAIAYAKYIAARVSRDHTPVLPAADGGAATLGLMFDAPPSDEVLQPFADVANACGLELVYFLLGEISFRAGSISGYRLENQAWAPRLFVFPDAVYSMIDQGGLDASHELYRLKSNFPLTSREPKGPIPSPLFFAIASSHQMLERYLPQHVRPENSEAAKRFTDDRRFVIMKSGTASHADDIILIQRLPTHYAVREDAYVHSFDEAGFLDFLELFAETDYMLIEQVDSQTHDGHSLHIRAFLFRQPDGDWNVIHIEPLLALASSESAVSLPGPVNWDWLLDREFGDEDGADFDERIRMVARTMAMQIQAANRFRIHELVLDFAVDHQSGLKLLGGDFDGPGDVIHPYDLARQVIPYVQSLLRTS